MSSTGLRRIVYKLEQMTKGLSVVPFGTQVMHQKSDLYKMAGSTSPG